MVLSAEWGEKLSRARRGQKGKGRFGGRAYVNSLNAQRSGLEARISGVGEA